MRGEFLITGIILIGVGLGLAGFGYNKIQPSKFEKTVGLIKELTEDITGEKMPDLPRRITTEFAIMMIFGGISFLAGLGLIFKSGQRKVGEASNSQRENQYLKYCPNCSVKISAESLVCPMCGQNLR